MFQDPKTRATGRMFRSKGGADPRSSLRTAPARLADCILVLDGGRIVEDGTHEQLLARRGLYHRMISAQAATWPALVFPPPPSRPSGPSVSCRRCGFPL